MWGQTSPLYRVGDILEERYPGTSTAPKIQIKDVDFNSGEYGYLYEYEASYHRLHYTRFLEIENKYKVLGSTPPPIPEEAKREAEKAKMIKFFSTSQHDPNSPWRSKK